MREQNKRTPTLIFPSPCPQDLLLASAWYFGCSLWGQYRSGPQPLARDPVARVGLMSQGPDSDDASESQVAVWVTPCPGPVTVNHTMVCFPNKPPNHTMVCFLTGGHQLWQLIGSDSEGKLFLWGYPKTAPPPKRRSSLLLTSARSAPKILIITL